MNTVKIVYKNIDDLIPYENNPRKNDDAVDKVALSISAFGFRVPVVIDTNNIIVTGHTRVKSAKKLGMTEVPCLIADDLTDEQIKAFRLADNKTAELAEWDFNKLQAELDALPDIDMSEFGFDLDFGEDEPTTQTITQGKEINLDEYEDENFECECPKCGFKFNRK